MMKMKALNACSGNKLGHEALGLTHVKDFAKVCWRANNLYFKSLFTPRTQGDTLALLMVPARLRKILNMLFNTTP